MTIEKLSDLIIYKSAPSLNICQKKRLFEELNIKILGADWLTVGIMAFSDRDAIVALKSVSKRYSIKFNNLISLKASGSVFLKANQKTGNVNIRSENGLGEGILVTCQSNEELSESTTYGPFPLGFFND